MARHPERLAVLGRHNEAEILTRIGKNARVASGRQDLDQHNSQTKAFIF